jgi:hypothetical protein
MKARATTENLKKIRVVFSLQLYYAIKVKIHYIVNKTLIKT